MRGKYRIFAVLALFLALALVVSACSKPAPKDAGKEGEGGGQQAGPVKLGILLPATGDLAELGGPMINAVQLAVNDVNAAGGVLGQQVEVVQRDTQTNETAARDAMDQLANVEKVPVVVGAAGSGESFAALEVAKPAQVVMISPSATSPDFTTYDDGGFFFRTPPSDALQGKVMAQLAAEEGYKTAATMALNNPYGVAFKDVFIEAFKAAGGTMVADVLYDPQGTTFDSEVTQLVGAKPEVVILIGYPETGASILRSAYQQGLLETTDLLLSEGMQSEALAEKVGKDASGRYILVGVRGTRPKSQGPAYADFAAKFQAAYGAAPAGPFDAHSYDAGVLALLAIQQAGKAEGPAIKDALLKVAGPPGTQVSDVAEALALLAKGEDIDYEGASSSANMDAVGDVLSDYEVWEIQDDGGIKAIKDVTPQ